MSVDRIRVASAPVSFGVDEIIVDDAWMPRPVDMLDWMVEIGFEGTELGPPGFLGSADEVRERLSSRSLDLVGAFLPQHFSRNEKGDEDRAWLRNSLRLIRDGAPEGSHPLAILSDHFDEPERLAFSGRIADHPEAWLPPDRFEALIANLHRAAELCRGEGFEVVLHPHAGTYVETADEIARVMDRLDSSLLGLCLDTGHFRFGGADPAQSVDDYHELIRHVHIKDCLTKVMDDVKAEGKGLEEALSRGVFCQLGLGDSGIDAVLEALRRHEYHGWLVIEQDQFLRRSDTPESVVAIQRANREYLRRFGF
ncbi:MAG: TIM barrel protein [Chloroflexota bacterium]